MGILDQLNSGKEVKMIVDIKNPEVMMGNNHKDDAADITAVEEAVEPAAATRETSPAAATRETSPAVEEAVAPAAAAKDASPAIEPATAAVERAAAAKDASPAIEPAVEPAAAAKDASLAVQPAAAAGDTSPAFKQVDEPAAAARDDSARHALATDALARDASANVGISSRNASPKAAIAENCLAITEPCERNPGDPPCCEGLVCFDFTDIDPIFDGKVCAGISPKQGIIGKDAFVPGTRGLPKWF